MISFLANRNFALFFKIQIKELLFLKDKNLHILSDISTEIYRHFPLNFIMTEHFRSKLKAIKPRP